MTKIKKFAFCYDFDGTLCPEYMMNHHLLPDCKVNPKIFWKKVVDYSNRNKCDPTLAYLKLLMTEMKESNIDFSSSIFKKYGRKIILFKGVESWFRSIEKKIKKKFNVNIEHYIISSGLEEMIKGCKISKNIKKIFASSYIFNRDFIWPRLSVNYSNKVQFLYRIYKGKFDVFDNAGVNNKIEDKKVYIPFENIFFFGDGETDIPTFVVNKKNGGTSICVYENDETSKKNAKKILREKRVNFIVENDYSENGPIEKLINTIMELNINFSVSS